jgi:very-short-patch-repair endonuclease
MPKPRAHLIAPAILQRARDFRHPLTPPEAKVWHAVRKRQLGFKFRRQHPIGRFIGDFYCAESKLVIEIDGDVHGQLSQEEHDRARDAWLVERGYKVIRFPARQVEQDLDGVLRRIMEACEARSG